MEKPLEEDYPRGFRMNKIDSSDFEFITIPQYQ
jgi:hypothetical protein